ncbi:MAG: AmmeMemoRadiSam system protein B, partial [Actinobacteria bacterium]|nr:AmmeMemoRadiSam system protein B [Actinomycetota bacterium]
MVKRKKLLFFLVAFGVLIFILLLIKINKKPMTPISSLPKQESIRQAAVAGSFYPADTKVLKAKLENFLSQAKPITTSGQLKILIVPHAGIDYSGEVAAWGFKQAEGKDYKRIIILGASHQAYLDYAALDDSDAWETPLGKVDIDKDLVKVLVSQEEKIKVDSSPHRDEHSLEIELIFLQEVFSGFKIVPILVSQPSDETIDYLAKKISQNLDDQTLLVVSSDLSHYPSWETANRVDKQTIEAIISGKKDNFERTIK